jgi:hypothetical protein
MTSLIKRSSNKIIYSFVIVILLTVGCSEKEKPDKYIAKVDDVVLTKNMMDSSLSDNANSAKGKDEFINDWIRTEILFNEAEKEGITKEKEFLSILERSKKELAATLFLKKLISKTNFEPGEDELKKYYDEKKDDFRLTEDLFKMNLANFSEYNKAIQFRNKLLETNWITVENMFRMDKSIGIEKNRMLYRSELQPVVLSRVVSFMLPNEISIILETQPGKYAVIQILEKYSKESIPPFEEVKEEVKNRLTIFKKQEFVGNYINKLISDHNLEIERYSE